MHEAELEDIMRRFISGEFDVLICTTIIESGIDIPNANTIIIDRSHTLGLAQLYQLRGRVGRSDRQGYCYFLTPDSGMLSATARERLFALESLEDLGVGYHLALRDLEIRGAGNLLGREQTGHIFEIGYELYCKMIEEAIRELQGRDPSITELIEPEILLPFESYIPETFMPDVSDRLSLYQRLSFAAHERDFDLLSDEIADRFGGFPAEVSALFEVMRLRASLRHYAVERLEIKNDGIFFSFHRRNQLRSDIVVELMKKPALFKIMSNNRLFAKIEDKSRFESLEAVRTFCESLLEHLCEKSL
jgi:transcription-repair coupling factor (superfamily II helicase)